ncbi:hypothetical protein LCGC14_1470920 [marine sediment metagenome]|uniref:Uncharacterized protein n=1 Tax=marine sediment metagenome TaxID=412755 RepID=A0A0F9JD14_9ZZZZ
MSSNTLPDKTTSGFGRRQDDDRRVETIGASVSTDEKEAILTALHQSGFANQSHGIRTVLLAFAQSAAVRDATAKALATAA